MNYKQKIGYTLLGAGLMLVGLAVGVIVSPRLLSPSNVVFDKVQCRELEVVDANGNKAISLRSNDTSSTSVYYDKQGNVAMILGSIDEIGRGVSIYDQYGKLMVGLASSSGWDNLKGSGLTVYDMHGEIAVELASTLRGNEVRVYDRFGNVDGELVTKEDNWVPFEELTR